MKLSLQKLEMRSRHIQTSQLQDIIINLLDCMRFWAVV
ncbi:MAG: hypothetical protein ACI9EW_004192 [Cellvibrionaceae bacterium]